MNTKLHRLILNRQVAEILAIGLLVVLLVCSDLAVFAQSGRTPQPESPPADAPAQEPTQAPTQAPATEAQDAPKIPTDQLDALVAPIALYPDPLLSQEQGHRKSLWRRGSRGLDSKPPGKRPSESWPESRPTIGRHDGS